jgi:hypothetical protein
MRWSLGKSEENFSRDEFQNLSLGNHGRSRHCPEKLEVDLGL